MSLNRRDKKSAVEIVSLTDDDLYTTPPTHRDQLHNNMLYMMASPKYQYELDGEKVLSYEHEDLPPSGNSLYRVYGVTLPHPPTTTSSITNLDHRYVVTPDLTISSGCSVHHRPGITLVDDAVVGSSPFKRKKFSTLLRLKLKVVYLFANRSKRERMHQ